MKSGLAAMVCAVERWLAGGARRGRLAFLLTSDEEGMARHGTRHVAEVLRARGEKPDYAIVGEASSHQQLGDRIVVGRRGSLGCNLRVLGKQGHVAYPHKADNPIHRTGAGPGRAGGHRMGPRAMPIARRACFQVSNLQAGTGANNVIPGEADVIVCSSYCTESTAEGLTGAGADRAGSPRPAL